MEMHVAPLSGGIQHVTLDGAFDIRGAADVDLRMATLAGAHDRILVDLSRVTFLASIGIRTLLVNARAVARRGGRFVLAAPQPMVNESLATAGIVDLIATLPTIDSAIEALSAAP